VFITIPPITDYLSVDDNLQTAPHLTTQQMIEPPHESEEEDEEPAAKAPTLTEARNAIKWLQAFYQTKSDGHKLFDLISAIDSSIDEIALSTKKQKTLFDFRFSKNT